MRNIWTIFKTDIRTLSRCFFACVVVLAIALLPSLYAWLNIYSNWDPYGSTGGISIAVASLDRGYTDGGEYVNKGRDVLEDLEDRHLHQLGHCEHGEGGHRRCLRR